MNYKKLDELNKLRLSGALTDEEFEREKQKLFNEDSWEDSRQTQVLPLGLTENSYLALMNFAMLVPYIGWAAPIILWIVGKNASDKVQIQGKDITNWLITWGAIAVTYGILTFTSLLFVPLMSFVATLFMYPALAVFYIVCSIVGGIKAINGQTWRYPLTISFIK